jgi:hypothetical protein
LILHSKRPLNAVLYELLEPFADQVVSNAASAYGHVSTYLALAAATVGWDERADEHFALACDLQEEEGMLLWAARACACARARLPSHRAPGSGPSQVNDVLGESPLASAR